MPNKRLFIFRHGETDWNVAKRFQGHSDIPLNAKGMHQAESLRPLMQLLAPQIVLSSDLSRAFETAKIAVQDLNIHIEAAPELREANLGDVEGMLRDEIVAKWGDGFIERWFDAKDLDFTFPNGETKIEHSDRLILAIETFIYEHSKFERFAISTHGGSVHRLIHSCENPPKESLWVKNANVFEVELRPLAAASADGVTEYKWYFVGHIELNPKD
jgi:broad specificity phosphatase PhoE